MYTISINLRSAVYNKMNTNDLLRLLEFLDSEGFNYIITENNQETLNKYQKKE